MMSESEIEIERDEPIYLMCRTLKVVKMFWYIIEEDKEQPHIQKPKQKTDEKLSDEGEIEVLRKSETDRIRSLRLPNLSNSHTINKTEFFVFNSCLYLLGDIDLDPHRHPYGLPNNLVKFCHLNLQNQGWQIAASFVSRLSYPTAVTRFNNGSVFIDIGTAHDAYFLNYSPKSNHLDLNLIRIPPSTSFHQTYKKKLIGLRVTDVVWNMFESDCRYEVCFNLETRKWRWIDDDNESFNGIWSKGVVLYDSYLFTFGTIHPDKVDPSLRVYNLNTRKWLPDRNEYGNFDKKKVLPRLDYHKNTLEPFLLQVRDNKLALVWYEYTTIFQERPRNIIHCTKFIIHKPSSDTDDTLVYPKVVSHGSYRVDGLLIKAAARVTVREDDEGNLDQGRAKYQCHKIVEQVNQTKGKEKERRGRLFLGRNCKKPKI